MTSQGTPSGGLNVKPKWLLDLDALEERDENGQLPELDQTPCLELQFTFVDTGVKYHVWADRLCGGIVALATPHDVAYVERTYVDAAGRFCYG